MRGRTRTWTDEELVTAVAKHTSFRDVMRELRLRPAGGNHAAIKRHIERLALDTSHFDDERRVRGLRRDHARRRLPVADVFCEASTVCSAVLRRRARHLLLPVRCALCGNTGEWQGKPLTLQLDHSNGRYDDNRLENLRWLCPNCHSQTETFAGRGGVRRARHVREAPPRYRARRRPVPSRAPLLTTPN
jgi:5-methylcytosine-specific restriction endonuclease McrA